VPPAYTSDARRNHILLFPSPSDKQSLLYREPIMVIANADAPRRASADDSTRQRQVLTEEWQRLCERFLPISPEKSIWRMSRAESADAPPQGWKLHISATILSANEIFRCVAPWLSAAGILFKAPVSLQELSKLNCGLFYGYSQVGKFITVYPKNATEAITIAQHLHKLTARFSSPPIPYDIPLRQHSCIYYRYGGFSGLEIENPDGTRTPAIRNAEGALVPDRREFGQAVPDWEKNPFPPYRHRKVKKAENPLIVIKAMEALSQRGKGGVYRAIDLRQAPARWCVLKEGRRHGETDWDGRDGYWRIKHEAETLRLLASSGLPVPEIYLTFELKENAYLVTEFIEGDNLQARLSFRRKKLPLVEAIDYGLQLAELLDKIHSSGWAWRDCKPLNLIVTPEGTLRPLDFEGACRLDAPDRMPWGTSGYVLPERLERPFDGSRVPDDLFALGATLHQLISGRTPDASYPLPAVGTLRRGVPQLIKEIISTLCSADPRSQPDAGTVARLLRAVSAEFGPAR
jgi:hypothetical protein